MPIALVTSFVECPYCDGENVVAEIGSNRDRSKLRDREIACRHCQCLFLVSESYHGVRSRFIEPPSAA
jgi:transposase-like protein